jgi:hypothetical protein
VVWVPDIKQLSAEEHATLLGTKQRVDVGDQDRPPSRVA